MKSYPFVEEEFQTMRTLLNTRSSIARYGDGELRVALGSGCKCQERDPALAEKLRFILQNPIPELMVGIPRIRGRNDLWRYQFKKASFWSRFESRCYLDLLSPNVRYFSSFITRVDNAPQIDCEDFWKMWKILFTNQDIVVIVGSGKFKNNPDLFQYAKSVEMLDGFPDQHAAREYGVILRRCLKIPKDRMILLSLGPTATALAYDLHKAGYRALDVGHLEMFYRRGRYTARDLISKELEKQYIELKQRYAPGYGGSGYKWAETVLYLSDHYGAKNILDYGSGKGTLKKRLEEIKTKARVLNIEEYDPTFKGKNNLPDHPYEMVVCTDVLEHVELDKLDNVLDYLSHLIGKIGFFVIALREANKTLPDGRNAHLIVKAEDWWINKISENRKWRSVEVFPCIRDHKDLAILVRQQ